MATDDRQILVTGTAPAPATWLVPGNGQVTPRSVFAHYDGTGAAAAFFPALKVISDAGQTVGIYPCGIQVAAGGSADVSWFPGVGATGRGSTQSFIGARVEATTNQTIHSSTPTDLKYETVYYDTDGMTGAIASDGRYLTVNTPGWYLVSMRCVYAFNGTGRRIGVITQNGFYSSGSVPDRFIFSDNRNAIWTGGAVSAASENSISAVLLAGAGDFFASGIYQVSGGDLNVNGSHSTYLSASLIGV